ncbi:MAG: hypothetical protein HXY41_16525 [Chloroflexi bacterium]|nr:hypothetical protein [Chloroflexota bacterium]
MIRICSPDTDYKRVADLLNLVETNPVTADTIRRWDSREGSLLRRSVSVDDSNHINGYSVVAHAPWVEEGRFFLWMIVDPAQRGRGIGAGRARRCHVGAAAGSAGAAVRPTPAVAPPYMPSSRSAVSRA